MRKFIVTLTGLAAAVLVAAPSTAGAAARAYELVSPVDKGGTDVAGVEQPYVSADGEVSAYSALNALPGADPVANGAFNFYRSVRGPEGWTARQLGSPLGSVNNINVATYDVFSTDLMTGVQWGPATPTPTPGAIEGILNLFLDDGSGFRLITPGLTAEGGVQPLGGSDDLSRVVFTGFGPPLDPEALPAFTLLYEWDVVSETPKIVGRLPDGTPSDQPVDLATPPMVSEMAADSFNPISADGSRIFFFTTAGSTSRELYVRINGAQTKRVSESRRTEPDPIEAGGPTFRVASDDGSVVYFSSREKLTDDATTGPTDSGEDLYRYEVDSGELTDISVDTVDPNGAEVEGVLGTSADGSRVYFVARGALAPGAVAGENNLYLWTADGSADGEITYIAPDASNVNWRPNFSGPLGDHVGGRVTPDGRHLLFHSSEGLTGNSTAGHLQVYLYDAESGELRCPSCNPAGTPATADATAVGAGDMVRVARTLSDDGSRVFFNTAERLAGGDTNGAVDVYEYDAANGRINLISSGKGEHPSRFADATPDGRDVLFTTREQLVGIDRDTNVDVYDARIGGGIAAQNPPPPTGLCSGDACRGTVAPPPPAGTPASTQVNGPGNAKPRRKPNCRKKQNQKRKHCKKAHRKSNHKNHHTDSRKGTNR